MNHFPVKTYNKAGVSLFKSIEETHHQGYLIH